jgi:hypothetical protein
MEQDTMRVRRIELIDENGTPRAILEGASQGVSGLIVHDVTETGTSASIGLDNNGIPFLLLVVGGREKGRVFACATPDGPVIRVVDENGEEKDLTSS